MVDDLPDPIAWMILISLVLLSSCCSLCVRWRVFVNGLRLIRTSNDQLEIRGWGRFHNRRQVASIAERRSHPDASRNDILTLLMSARDEAGEALTDAE